MSTQLRRPEALPALINAIVVLFLPTITTAVLSIAKRYDRYDYTVTVHPSGWSALPGLMQFVLVSALLMSPFALVAAWRTWVHAGRWLAGDRRWQGIWEAGGLGLGVVLLGLAGPILNNPRKAPPYVIAYGTLGLIVGLGIGLLLQLVAIIVLHLANPFSEPDHIA